MKVIRFTSTAAIVLLCGALVPAYAQHEGGEKQEEKAKPQEQHAQQPRREPAAPQQHAAQTKAQAEPRPAQQPRSQTSQPRPQQAKQTQPARQAEQNARQASPQQEKRLPQPGQQPQARQQTQARQQAQPQRTQQQARAWQQQKGWAQGGASVGHATFAQDRSSNWSSDHRTWAQRGGYGGYYIPQATFSVSFGSRHFFRLGGMPSMYMGYPRFSDGGFSFLILDPWPGDWAANWYSSDDVYVDYENDGYYLFNRSYPQERLAVTIVL